MERRRPLALSLAFVTAAVLGACGGGQADAPRDETGAVTEAGEVSVFRLRVGDCLLQPGGSEFTSANVVPCDQSHDLEVYLAFNVTGADHEFPGEDELFDIADERCFDAFEPFVGAPYETSELDYYYAYPTEEGWRVAGDREILCFVANFDDTQKVGTARDSRR